MTTFKNQLYHMGGVPVGGGMLPPMGRSSSTGGSKAFFIHGALGADGNSGTSAAHALKTLTEAYDRCEDGRGDSVYILNDGTSTASIRDVALVWAKDNCHIVGLCAPTMVNQRSRIAPPTTSAVDVDAYTPYLTLSASGCSFMNVGWFQGQSEDTKTSVGVLVSGSRNYFNNVTIATGAATNQGDEECYALQITGSENTFEKCCIGIDTYNRGNNAVSANVRFGNDASDRSCRNVFIGCIFPAFCDDTEPCFIYAKTAADCDRWQLFRDCTFVNSSTALGGSTMDAGVKWLATCGGILLLQNSYFYGVTNVTAADSAYVQIAAPTPGTPVDAGMFQGVDIAP